MYAMVSKIMGGFMLKRKSRLCYLGNMNPPAVNSTSGVIFRLFILYNTYTGGWAFSQVTVAYNPVLWSEDRAYANNLLESLLTLNRPTQNKQISRWIQFFFDPASKYPLRKLKFVVHGPFMITRALLSFQRI